MENSTVSTSWVFFGTEAFSVIVLEELKAAGFLPTLIVTVPDKPKGRGNILTPPEVKVWAEENNISYIQPQTLRNSEVIREIQTYSENGFEFFVVALYGKILSKEILDIPQKSTLNVHPSLLPKLRGASPIETAILEENETGVSIMKLDTEMDHGAILAQEKIEISDWPPYAEELENELGHVGGKLLGKILPDWLLENVEEKEQDHVAATFCKKIEKTDALLDLTESAEKNLRKIRAYHLWPGAYFFHTHNEKTMRIVVKKAHIEDGNLILDRIIPEGKKEMDYADFMRNRET